MQTANINVPVRVDGRHVTVTEALRNHVEHKVSQLHLDYPRIIEVHVVVDVQKHGNRHFAEAILRCADHITLEASATTDDLYASLDLTFGKIGQQMRKAKARHLLAYRRRGARREGLFWLRAQSGWVPRDSPGTDLSGFLERLLERHGGGPRVREDPPVVGIMPQSKFRFCLDFFLDLGGGRPEKGE